MARFKVGDRARIINVKFAENKGDIGAEIVIDSNAFIDPTDGAVVYYYLLNGRPDINPSKGYRFFIRGEFLEPILDKPASWEAVEEITDGWNPAKVRVAV